MSKTMIETMKERYSCRKYDGFPLPAAVAATLEKNIAAPARGPFGTTPVFVLAAARPGDDSELKGLGTYGFIKNPSAFILGAAEDDGLEDFGYRMEELVLEATALGLGSCWLGGTFRRSGFERTFQQKTGGRRRISSIIALGNIPRDSDQRQASLRTLVGGAHRRPWETLFFEGDAWTPFAAERANDRLGPWATVLEMVRGAPSASNKQPWRILKTGDDAAPVWSLWLERTPGYGNGLASRVLKIADIQRIDMGIAMAHFALAAAELRLPGVWSREKPVDIADKKERGFVAAWRT